MILPTMALRTLPTFLLLCCTLALLPSLQAKAEDAELRSSLQKVYSEWRSALLAKNLTAWRTCTTAYRQVFTHNLIVSQKLRYPDAIFELPVTPPDPLKLKLLEVEANGPTAHLIYFGKIDLGIGKGDVTEIPENLLVLKFFQDRGGWKFDSTKFINLADNPDMRDACKNGNPEFLKHDPFNPPGVVPAVPKPCKEPEKMAMLRVQAIGYEVIPTVNGYENTPVVDTAEQQLLIGGLNRGDNEAVLQIKEIPVPEGEERYLEVEAVLMHDQPRQAVTRVFDWVPTTKPVPATVMLNIIVNNATQRGI